MSEPPSIDQAAEGPPAAPPLVRSSTARHTLYNLAGALIPLASALVTVPLYIRLIGPARYGVLAIAWILLGYFGLFDLGLGRATAFRIAELRDDTAGRRAGAFWAAVSVNLLMGVVGAAALWAAAQFFFGHLFKIPARLRPEIMAAVPLLAMAVPVATLSGVLGGALQGREKFLGMNVVSVVSTLAFQVLPLMVVWRWGPNLVGILAAALLARLGAMIALAWLCHVEVVGGQPIGLGRDEAPRLLRYGGWVTVAALLSPLLVIVDRFAIGATLGAVAVAVYTIPYQPAKQLQTLPSALTTALFPKISTASPHARLDYARNATLALASLVGLPVLGALFLAESALRLWVGPALGEQAAPVARLLLLGFWINAFAMVPYTTLQASGRPDLVTKVQIAEMPPYYLALYLGLSWLGVVGAALAFLFRCAIDYLLLDWAARPGFAGLGPLVANLALLVAGAWLSSQWPISDGRWWFCAFVLGLAMTALAWWTLPASLKDQVGRPFGVRRRTQR